MASLEREGRRARGGPLVLLLLAVLSAGCGKDREQPTACATCSQVKVYGRVTGGEGVLPAKVFLQPARPPHGGSASGGKVETSTNRFGQYELFAPPGSYFLGVEREETKLYFSHLRYLNKSYAADTVHLVEGPIHIDFRCGGLVVSLSTDASLAAEELTCTAVTWKGEIEEASATLKTVIQGDETVFRFPFLRPDYHVLMIQVGSNDWFYLPTEYRLAGAYSYHITAGDMSTGWGEIPAPARLSGRIEGSWRTMGLEPPTIQVWPHSRESLSGGGTDAEGRFTVNLFGQSQARVRVLFNNASAWIGGDSYDEATPFALRPGEETGGVSLVESGIECRLEVGLWDRDTWLSFRLEDALGNYVAGGSGTLNELLAIAGLRPGSFFLRVNPTSEELSYAPVWFDSVPFRKQATSIVIASEGEVASITFHAAEGADIEGRVLPEDGSGSEFSGAWLTWTAASDSSAADSAGTIDSGWFRLGRLIDGDYRIAAQSLNGGLRTWYPGTAHWDSAAVITIVGHQDVTGVEWRLLPSAGSRRGD